MTLMKSIINKIHLCILLTFNKITIKFNLIKIYRKINFSRPYILDKKADPMETVFITISPPTSLLKLGYRHQDYYDRIDPVLRRIGKSYILYPEFDDKGRLHYHGFIHGYDQIKYFATAHKLNRIGWTKIDKIKSWLDNLRLVIYCQKQWRKTSQVFEYADIKIKPLFKKNLRNSNIGMVLQEPPKTTIFDFIKMD